MDAFWHDRRVWITGASSGIGRAVAVSLGGAGANVCVNYVVGPDGKSPLAPSFVDVSALLACVGIFFGVALKSLTSHSLIAARDPRIARALSFEQV